MTRVLVTGGAGYIGSHTAKALAGVGWEPIVLDNLSTGHQWAVKWGPLERADLAEVERVRQVIEQYKVEAVIHFAGSAYVGESMVNPQKYFRNNVGNTLNLLDAMRDTGVKHIVFSSTCATYGVPQTDPIPEDHPQVPVNVYGESKLSAERAIRWYGHAYGLRWLVLRFFNAAGADPGGELGEVHDPEPHLIPLVIQAALGQRPGVEIYGTDYPTPDGTAVRDYTHVLDLAQAHIKALRYLLDGGESVALNLGKGKGHSVREVIQTVERVSGLSVPVKEVSRRQGDPPVLVADARKAEQVLGWQAEWEDLDRIVKTAWDWHSQQLR